MDSKIWAKVKDFMSDKASSLSENPELNHEKYNTSFYPEEKHKTWNIFHLD